MKYPILILHGWGRFEPGQHRFREVQKLLEEKGFSVFAPDLPGFGSNTLKKEELFFDDYVLFVRKFIQKKKLKKVILVGHSFGGRIAIAFSAKYPQYVAKLILVSASGIPRPLPSLKKRIVYRATKILRPLFVLPGISFFYKKFRKLVYYAIGEMDYYKSEKLQQTFKNVYKVSIVNDLPKIKVPTLIVWGEEDTMTPLADGKLMHGHITNSILKIVSHAGHKFPYEYPKKFVDIILKFIS